MSDGLVQGYLLNGRQGNVISLLNGLLIPFSFAPFNTIHSLFSWLLYLPLSLFLYQILHAASARDAGYKGGLFGIGLFTAGVSWIYIAINVYGNTHWTLAGALTSVLILYLAMFYALFGWSVFKLKTKIQQRGSHSELISALVVIPVLWVFFEWLRSWILTGFPWLLIGYPAIQTPLAGYAPVTGIFGVSLLTVWIAALLAVMFAAPPLVSGIKKLTAFIVAGLIFSVGFLLLQIEWTEPVGEALDVALIQGNVTQSVKWEPQQLKHTKQLYTGLSMDQWQKNDLIVWPENAIPGFYHSLEKNFYKKLASIAKRTNTELIVGLPVFDDKTQQYYNGMTNLGGQQGFYYKTHLVPFGEYVPLASLLRELIRALEIPMSSFSAGDSDQPLLDIKHNKAAVTICYEDIFPAELLSRIPAARFMINLSNNGWYGHSLALPQHLEMARFRALETGRDIIRSTTSGISALIDAKGNIMVEGPQFETAIINGSIQPRTGLTPYVIWGNYPVFLLFIGLGLFLLLKTR
jgi:apolipoprotein N-acyltransferase